MSFKRADELDNSNTPDFGDKLVEMKNLEKND